MKYLIIISFLLLSISVNSQNYNKLFKSIESEDFDKSEQLIKELKEDKDVDSSIISLANAIIFSNKNHKDYNPIKSYELLLFTLNANLAELKKLNSVVSKFKLNFDAIKLDIENKVFEYSEGVNHIDTYKRIIDLCNSCSYLNKANLELEKLEFNKAIKNNTIESLNEFISKYPSSKNTSIITDKRDLLEFNLSKKDIKSLTDFISKHPQSSLKEKAVSIRDSLNNNLESVYYYENGKIKEIGKYKEGRKSGKWIQYFENGSIDVILNYNKDKIDDGEYTYYNENGEVSCIATFKNAEFVLRRYFEEGKEKKDKVIDIRDGQHLIYDNKGQISKEENYKNGKLDGEQIEYENNGQIRSIWRYSNDILNGEKYEKKYDGETTISNFLNGESSGLFITKDNQNRILFQGYYYENEKAGEWKADRYNNKVRETIFEGNFSNGIVRHYSPDGSVSEIENYKNGKLNGDYLEYYNKKLISSGKFLNDYPTGKWLLNYGDGQIKFNGNCSPNGVVVDFSTIRQLNDIDYDLDFNLFPFFFTGICEFYYKNGKILFKGDFTNGEVKYFLQNGQLYKTENYKDNKLISKTDFSNDSRNKTIKYFYNDSKKANKIEFYFQNSTIAQIEEVANEFSYFDDCNYGLLNEDFIEKNIELIIFINDKAVFNGYSKCTDSTPLLSNENISVFKNGHLIFYRRDLQKMSEGEILNGNKIGLWKNYDENGDIRETVFYSETAIKTYFKDGVLESVQNCKNFILNGETIEYFRDGKIKSIEHYLNGKLDCRLEDKFIK